MLLKNIGKILINLSLLTYYFFVWCTWRVERTLEEYIPTHSKEPQSQLTSLKHTSIEESEYELGDNYPIY